MSRITLRTERVRRLLLPRCINFSKLEEEELYDGARQGPLTGGLAGMEDSLVQQMARQLARTEGQRERRAAQRQQAIGHVTLCFVCPFIPWHLTLACNLCISLFTSSPVLHFLK